MNPMEGWVRKNAWDEGDTFKKPIFESVEDIFARYDKDGTGFLDKAEMKKFLREYFLEQGWNDLLDCFITG